MRTNRTDLMAGARIVGVISIVLVAGPGSRRTDGMDRAASAPLTHVVSVGADGAFSPDFLYVSDGDTVEWRLYDRTDTVIPAQSNDPFPAICSGQKPYDATDPNEFTGPMPHWPSGIFTLGPDDRGLAVVADAADCPTQVIAAAGGQFLCRAGAEGATMDWTWQNPNLTGVFARIQWKDVHKGPGNFDWRILDRELDQAVQNGKLYNLAFKAGSNGTPNWIFDDPVAPVTRLTFQDLGDEDECESPPCCGVRMDLGSPADPNFRKHYFDLLTAAAAHVKSRNDWYRALAYIKPSGMNLFTHENRLPRNCQCGCSICNSEVWATQGNYTPAALYEFYRLQSELMVASFPEKSMSYALIQAGFPLVNGPTEYETCEAGKPANPGGTEQTEQILSAGRILHGLDFVVQHNGLQIRPQDRTPPLPACPGEGIHPKEGPFGSPAGCPNRWVLREGAAGQVTTFQTQNAHGVGNPVELESSLRNGLDNSDGIFVEIYEDRFWEAEVGGPVLDPSAAGRTIAEWANTFHAQRRSLWPNLPDPFPMVHRHTFARTAGTGSNPQLFPYIHGSKCGKTGTTNFGVIAVLPQGVPTPTITPTPVATATCTSTITATPRNTATGTATATSPPAATSTATFSNTPEPTATASHTRTATASVTRAPTSTATPSRSATSIATPTAARSPSATVTRTAVPCVGDCGADGEVTVDELIRGVNIALGSVSVSTCPSFDVNRDRSVTVDELVVAVNAALRGCPSVS